MTVREMLTALAVDIDQRPASFDLRREPVEMPTTARMVRRVPGPWLEVTFVVAAEPEQAEERRQVEAEARRLGLPLLEEEPGPSPMAPFENAEARMWRREDRHG
jgi:hypothetical protein